MKQKILNSRIAKPLSACAFILVLGAACVPRESRAQTPAENAADWGLLGTWMRNCSKATGSGSNTLSYVVVKGKHFQELNLSDGRDSYPVISAKKKPDGSIELLALFDSARKLYSLILAKDKTGRTRAVSTRDIDTNEYMISNGKYTENGKETAWLTRCK